MSPDRKKIILAGGGTMGSVSPLLAVARDYPADYLFVATKNGPEKEAIAAAGLKSTAIVSAKLRRYFSWRNFVDIINFIRAFFQSLYIISKFKPDLVLTAGSFVAVPVVWAAWLRRVPLVAHQQDLLLGLANKMIAPLAKRMTVVFPEQTKFFDKSKAVVIGNPVQPTASLADHPRHSILITGGGLGARGLNNFVSQFIPELTKNYEVHHILGEKNWDQRLELSDYYPYKFVFTEMPGLLAGADIIISRAGMSLISEAAVLKKALILIPIPDSHQEANAAFFARHNAAYVVQQGSKHIMSRYLSKLTTSDRLRKELGQNLYDLFPKNAVKKYCALIDELLNK